MSDAARVASICMTGSPLAFAGGGAGSVLLGCEEWLTAAVCEEEGYDCWGTDGEGPCCEGIVER